MYKIAAWFYIRITKDTSIKPLTYKIPKREPVSNKVYDIEAYDKEKEKIKEEHTKEVTAVKEYTAKLVQTEEDKKIQKEVESTLQFNESQTRKKLNDIMLKDAGWDINNKESVKLELPLENHKEKGKTGYADYVLFNKKEACGSG